MVAFDQSGYSGWSRSIRAEEAESKGILPLTRAIPVVARIAKCSRAEARRALLDTYSGEWHHVGLYARRTPYYDTRAAVAALNPLIARNEEIREAREYLRWAETHLLASVRHRTCLLATLGYVPDEPGWGVAAEVAASRPSLTLADLRRRGWKLFGGQRIAAKFHQIESCIAARESGMTLIEYLDADTKKKIAEVAVRIEQRAAAVVSARSALATALAEPATEPYL